MTLKGNHSLRNNAITVGMRAKTNNLHKVFLSLSGTIRTAGGRGWRLGRRRRKTEIRFHLLQPVFCSFHAVSSVFPSSRVLGTLDLNPNIIQGKFLDRSVLPKGLDNLHHHRPISPFVKAQTDECPAIVFKEQK